MIRLVPAMLALSPMLFLPQAGHAADLDKGKKLARKCSACHGKNGLSRDPEVPNLAGHPSLYLEKSMKDFREGIREDRRMTLIAKTWSDEDIKDLAEWFSSYKITVEAPE